MHRRFRKAILTGLLTGFAGFLALVSSLGNELEEDLGLHFLFKLRGERQAPQDVLIVNMDTESAQNLSLLSRAEKWPRSLHASVVQTLRQEGAKIIVFDIFFEEPRSGDEDVLFANAMKEAGNVLLCQSLRHDSMAVAGARGEGKDLISLEKLVSPVALLGESALGAAPFPLPKVPVKVSRYWTFKAESGDRPSLPVLAFHAYTAEVHREFFSILSSVAGSEMAGLPDSYGSLRPGGNLERVVQAVREIFLRSPEIGRRMMERLEHVSSKSMDRRKLGLLKGLVNMYRAPDHAYFNFYGSPGHMETVPYHVILQGRNHSADSSPWPEVRGKAVFIGLSQLVRPEQRDGFYTAFSQPTGIDMSGVEIAATAFANLLESSHLEPLQGVYQAVLVVGWGALLSAVCWGLSMPRAALCSVLAGSVYMAAAHRAFVASAIWLPIVVPLLVQIPLTFFGVLWWKYLDTHRERETIRRAFGFYLPDRVVDEISKGMGSFPLSGKTVHGTCLSTDAEQYARLSELMSPDALRDYLNRYYEAIFAPVRSRGGIVSDVVGDSMMAVWATSSPDRGLRMEACLAALEIDTAVKRFCEAECGSLHRLSTRIGLHTGSISLGNVGGIDHFEYRAVGDVVNTASRIERLNKLLGTRILLSREVIDGLEGLLWRDLGSFVLPGKSNPVVIYELMALEAKAREDQLRLFDLFRSGMASCRRESWKEAMGFFRKCLEISPKDGPSRFYFHTCREFIAKGTASRWEGVHVVNGK
ncbi:MAG: adenylate/guanylate cyclase domain-containing protein [Deltaproteobacteria bacterium]|nr:adenylate/guanylate cyclase domain-containing protein [Deltaproteobacteria bacterium]